MGPWRSILNAETIEVLAPDGTVRCAVQAYYSGADFIIDDMSVDIHAGDDVRRSGGDVFRVEEARRYERERGSFPPHYQVKITPRDLSGAGLASEAGARLFIELQAAIRAGIADPAARAAMLAHVDAAEAAVGTGESVAAYKSLIEAAASQMALLAPFIPGLTRLLV